MASAGSDLAQRRGFSPARADASGIDNRLLIAGIFVLALIPLFATPVLPFIDFYNHIARYYVLANIDHDVLLQQNYRANWSILPNIGLDVIVTALTRLLPEAAVPRTTVILIFAVQYAGLLYFNRALTGRASVITALLAVPLLYSFILNWGFANFLLGIGLAFGAAGWWVSQRDRLVVAVPVACVLAAVIFFVHGLAFALYGVLAGMLEIGRWWQSPQRRLPPLITGLVALAVQAVVPAMLFLMAKTSQNSQGLTNADEALTRLANNGRLAARLWALLEYRLTTIVRVAEGPSLAFDIAALVAMTVLLALLILRKRLRIAPVAVPAVLVFALLVIVVPPALFGVGYVADRMPLVLAMLLVGALDLKRQFDRFETLVFTAMAGLVALRLAGIALAWSAYAQDKRDFDSVAAALPAGALIENIVVGGDRLDYSRRRCTMFGPLLITDHSGVGRLFANEDQQPLVITGPLQRAIASFDRPSRGHDKSMGFFDKVVAATAQGDFPWGLVCDADRLTKALPPSAKVVARNGRFSLIRFEQKRRGPDDGSQGRTSARTDGQNALVL
ncbi:hypothetical protein [Polymorphobacter fuscus]|uniref:Glycosyltransferase RgtA/B/C/D-like domain-containing protein n=1 Tax=Sandarakinorhabdus fusca TaxID=1439888 RepID=A0A7C9KZF5_9SPHN|nr:hypothetical protein [Polymorphobacter fuscus]KAB7645512.1 hypothetical protein F9290_11835 [Polymorphobacter fuscus]MQT17948.1 hypothetical protein [Polymorphobacter fuscus]NJC08578.1 hypothetical protein [Polymorphobacter fuscus]